MIDARPVRGPFRRLRTQVEAGLIAIMLALPWIEIAGEPLLRLDVPNRRFHVFGLVIFPQELFFLWLLVIGLALALFFFTALAGRLWCGWACPQTVFSDLFAGIARRIKGFHGTRAPARIASWRIAASHVVLAALGGVIGFHLVAYFCSPRELLGDLLHGSASRVQVGFLCFGALVAYVDFALVRQTFCKYLCPYARFQGVMFDSDTLVVGYDTARGEPRGKRGKAAGDCVDCGLCVAVCPTQIDIRDGLQLECIACTQCIDACNGVMAKLGRKPELIGYRSLVSLESGKKARLLRPRVVIYAALLVAVGAAFATTLARRLPFELTVAHNAASLYETLADGRTGNAYTLRIENRGLERQAFRLALEAPSGFELLGGAGLVDIDGASSRELRVFVAAPASGAHAQAIAFSLEDSARPGQRLRRPAMFVFRPGGGGESGGAR
ncbi:MAG: cytochrome c oxidase accessory protein CcoG [Myxococcota bacterium]